MKITEKLDKKTETLEVIVELKLRQRSSSPITYYTTEDLKAHLEAKYSIDKVLYSDEKVIANTEMRGYKQRARWVFKLKPSDPPTTKKRTTRKKKTSTTNSVRDRISSINKNRS